MMKSLYTGIIAAALFITGMVFNSQQDVFGATPVSTVFQGGTGTGVIQNGLLVFGSTTLQVGTSSNLFYNSATNRFGIGTSTPTSTLHVMATSGTTTVTVGDGLSATSKSCFNVKTNLGAVASFYVVGTAIVVEARPCR